MGHRHEAIVGAPDRVDGAVITDTAPVEAASVGASGGGPYR